MSEPLRREPDILVFPDRVLEGMWRVEVLDADGDGGVAIAGFGSCRDAEAP